MADISRELTNQLADQFNQLFQHYRSKYALPSQIPGMAKIGPVEQRLMSLLEIKDDLPVKEIVSRLNMPNSTITSAMNRLVDKKLVFKEIDPEDRRAYRLVLAKRGKDMVTYNRYLKQQFAERVLEGLDTSEDRHKLLTLLDEAVQSLEQIDDDRVRSDYMNTLQKEYNGFGPWLIHIEDVEEVPQQYITHRDEILAADYAFKVPVKQDRHRLRPGMLMYNTVIAIYPDKLLILKASADSLTDYEVKFSEIRYLTSSRDLLDSHFIIGTDVRTFDIDYNSVSTDISDVVMEMLKERIFTDERAVADGKWLDPADIPKERYNVMISPVPEKDGMVFLGFQPGRPLEKNIKSTAEAILNFARRYDLQDLILMADKKTLLVVDSVHEVKHAEDPDYSFRHVYIRLSSISAVEMVEDDSMKRLMSLVIHAGQCQMPFKVGDEFDSTLLLRYLEL